MFHGSYYFVLPLSRRQRGRRQRRRQQRRKAAEEHAARKAAEEQAARIKAAEEAARKSLVVMRAFSLPYVANVSTLNNLY